MFIGLDVSHAPAGTNQASMAALTVSLDPSAARYGAACQTNGVRTEMMEPSTMKALLPRFIQQWVKDHKVAKVAVNRGPEHVYFFRDGVGTGQLQQVLDIEVKAIRETFQKEVQMVPKITVLIVTKRHHIRFFRQSDTDPSGFDKNENPYPGFLVERGATHPDFWDFFLNSHNAIQGTARPIHYQVILDEIRHRPDDLQRMVFHHCYQYCRSTQPVSLHPAVFYAHLASKRAVAHLQPATPPNQAGQPPTPAPLMSMRRDLHKYNEASPMEKTMWFV
ncbi:hypothetical protein PG993_002397 [Apiospora rasikravindrae]|uniref:Piwi domain-containing protein n=1 Tax=Apiospora rasikravindrae TaxID=990691 RepID=A0ABR1TWQ1_9PEZI